MTVGVLRDEFFLWTQMLVRIDHGHPRHLGDQLIDNPFHPMLPFVRLGVSKLTVILRIPSRV